MSNPLGDISRDQTADQPSTSAVHYRVTISSGASSAPNCAHPGTMPLLVRVISFSHPCPLAISRHIFEPKDTAAFAVSATFEVLAQRLAIFLRIRFLEEGNVPGDPRCSFSPNSKDMCCQTIKCLPILSSYILEISKVSPDGNSASLEATCASVRRGNKSATPGDQTESTADTGSCWVRKSRLAGGAAV